MKTAVVALGGNALLARRDRPSVAAQFGNAERAARSLMRLARRYRLVVTHGNGPQVGNILIRSESARGRAYPVPLSIAVAESEGETGYLLQQVLANRLHRPVVSLMTQVLVDARDVSFRRPTKPIGPFLSRAASRALARRGVPTVAVDHAWRRVVPSPAPLEVVEWKAVRTLAEAGIVVIAAGGGGVPVVRRRGRLVGVDAVVDKDLASARLAEAIDADALFLLTDVPGVFTAFGTRRAERIARLAPARARALLAAGEFPPGSMGPKVRAAIEFVESAEGRVARIGSLARPESGTVLA